MWKSCHNAEDLVKKDDDRLAVVTSCPDEEKRNQILAAPLIPDGSGRNMTRA